MTSNSSSSSNGAIFPQPSRVEWEKLAEATLKGRAVETLARPHEDGFDIDALYSSASHVATLPDHVSANAARHWVIAQMLEPAADVSSLHTMMMDELIGGCERLIFSSAQKISIVPNAMDGVMADAIVLSFDHPQDPNAAMDALVQIWTEQNTAPALARGALGVVVTPSNGADLLAIMTSRHDILARYPALRIMTISGASAHRDGASAAQELAVILAQFTMIMRTSEAMGLNLNDVMTRLEISLAIDADLYGGIAKARALHGLMARMLGVMEISCDDLSSRLHGITSDRMLAILDPETNMLRCGTAMLSMALSGMGVITNRPHDWLTGSSPLSRRIARNAHHLLADESQLNHIADPAQGSYYIDRLTHGLSEKAWQLFQEIEREGGIATAWDKGLITAWYNAAAAQRNDRVNCGVDPLLGVSIHPVSKSDTAQNVIIEPYGTAMLARGGDHRPAASWEALRDGFAMLKARCLLIDDGGNTASAIKRWMDSLGLEAAVMSADDKDSCITLITAASPDIVVLGDALSLTSKHQEALPKPPIFLKAEDFNGDVIAAMSAVLASLQEREAS